MLESSNPGDLMAVAASLLGLVTVAVRVWGRVMLARHLRRTLTSVANTLAATGRPARAQHRVHGAEWSLELTGQPHGQVESDSAR